jgi:hypothetical protein
VGSGGSSNDSIGGGNNYSIIWLYISSLLSAISQAIENLF